MSERYTRRDVDVQAQYVTTQAKRLGIIPDAATIELQSGSPTNGRGWRLFVDGHSFPGTGDRGYLGFTAREAYEMLAAIRRAWSAVEDLQR